MCDDWARFKRRNYDFVCEWFYRNWPTSFTQIGFSNHTTYIGYLMVEQTLQRQLDDVRIYNRTLSTSEIQHLYKLG